MRGIVSRKLTLPFVQPITSRVSVYALDMGFWAKAFRITALFLVLFTAGDVVACEMPGSDCSAVQTSDKQTPVQACDHCICCCATVVLSPQFVFVAPAATPVAPTEMIVRLLPSPSLEIDRPPQLS